MLERQRFPVQRVRDLDDRRQARLAPMLGARGWEPIVRWLLWIAIGDALYPRVLSN